jgi:hypothetical protein
MEVGPRFEAGTSVASTRSSIGRVATDDPLTELAYRHGGPTTGKAVVDWQADRRVRRNSLRSMPVSERKQVPLVGDQTSSSVALRAGMDSRRGRPWSPQVDARSSAHQCRKRERFELPERLRRARPMPG